MGKVAEASVGFQTPAREQITSTVVGEGGRIHSCVSQPFSECLVFAGHKEKTTRVLPKEADKEKNSRKKKGTEEAGNRCRRGRCSYIQWVGPGKKDFEGSEVLRQDFKVSSSDVSPSLHLLNENFNKAPLLSRESLAEGGEQYLGYSCLGRDATGGRLPGRRRSQACNV